MLRDHPSGYRYSQFCEHYGRFAKKLHPSMRQIHRAGEKVFVDFSGKKPSWVNPETGEVMEAGLFVGALGASGFIYAEATPSQDLSCWIGAHIRMREAWERSPAIFVPDNLKSEVTTPGAGKARFEVYGKVPSSLSNRMHPAAISAEELPPS